MKKLISFFIFTTILNVFPTSLAMAVNTPANIAATGNRGGSYLAGTVTVTWQSVTGATHYAVQTYLMGTAIGDPASVVGENSNQIVITGLQGGTEYTFKVRAGQDGLLSAWSTSAAATAITEPAPAPKPTHENEKLDVTVRWTAPSSDGGSSITSYLVTEVNSGASKTVASNVFSAKFIGMSAGSKVKFNVRAINDISTTGSISDDSTETTLPNVPAKVTGVSTNQTTNNDEVSVSWVAPAARGSAITSYTVYLRQSNRDIATKFIDDVSKSNYVFSGLAAGQYTSQVSATNAIGDSSRSDESNSLTIKGITPESTTTSGGAGGGGGTSTPTPTPTVTPTPTPTPTSTQKSTASPKPSGSKSSATKSKSGSNSNSPVLTKPVVEVVSIPKQIKSPPTKALVVDAKGNRLVGITVTISKSGKIEAKFPKGTKPGIYTVKIVTKNKKTFYLPVVVKKSK